MLSHVNASAETPVSHVVEYGTFGNHPLLPTPAIPFHRILYCLQFLDPAHDQHCR